MKKKLVLLGFIFGITSFISAVLSFMAFYPWSFQDWLIEHENILSSIRYLSYLFYLSIPGILLLFFSKKSRIRTLGLILNFGTILIFILSKIITPNW